jgi:hypothetical protein
MMHTLDHRHQTRKELSRGRVDFCNRGKSGGLAHHSFYYVVCLKVATAGKANDRAGGTAPAGGMIYTPSKRRISSHNEFGCGYCRRKGGLEDLQAFYDFVRNTKSSRDFYCP